MRFLIFICIIASLLGCSKNDPKVVLTYDLLNINESTELRLSDMVNDIRIVPLETVSAALIPDCNYIVDDKYIITLGKDVIHQFDAITGKYLKKLAVAGNGPNEFGNIVSAFVKNGKLYFMSMNKEYFSVIDLAVGEYLDKLETNKNTESLFWGMNSKGELYLDNDSMLFEIFDPQTKKSKFLIDTTMKKIIKEKANFSLFMKGIGGKSLTKYMNETYYYNFNFSDTLYFQKNDITEAIPFASFILPKAKVGTTSELGIPNIHRSELSFPYVDSRMYLCFLSDFILESSGHSLALRTDNKGVYYIDKNTGVAKRVNKYIFDPLFVTEFVNSSNIFSFHSNSYVGENIYAKAFPAYEVKTFIEESLGNPDFPEDKKAELRKLDGKLTEESNPVVFIGNKK